MRRALSEASTWAALAAMLGGAGFEVAAVSATAAAVLKVAGLVAGFVGVVMKEGGGGA